MVDKKKEGRKEGRNFDFGVTVTLPFSFFFFIFPPKFMADKMETEEVEVKLAVTVPEKEEKEEEEVKEKETTARDKDKEAPRKREREPIVVERDKVRNGGTPVGGKFCCLLEGMVVHWLVTWREDPGWRPGGGGGDVMVIHFQGRISQMSPLMVAGLVGCWMRGLAGSQCLFPSSLAEQTCPFLLKMFVRDNDHHR